MCHAVGDTNGFRARLFVFCAGEGRGQAESDESAAGDVALSSTETDAGTKTVGYGAGKDGPDGIAAPAHKREQNSQLENLQSGMAKRWIHKLRQKSQKEKRGFWIEQINQNALGENVKEPTVAVGGFQ